ncbi:hypothetical protein MUK42_05072 [Musa troglodytarum]|uniref:Uncharacterized protein n=1 Tax=Musa troglodytarum TaxID=320322 RepID=A0A9E7GD20_9LILI|nr:hypothetical protein MUK42_05072 [Musa troglodytarum]
MAAPRAVLCWWRRDVFTIIGVGSAGMCPRISCEREYRRACGRRERRELEDRLGALDSVAAIDLQRGEAHGNVDSQIMDGAPTVRMYACRPLY